MKITIGHLYPEMLNLYGDAGNIVTLKHRLNARGIECEIKTFSLSDEIDFSSLDIVYLGGGGEKEQLAVLKRLMEIKDDITTYAEDGGVLLGVCSGFELLGKTIKTRSETFDAVGILDAFTEYNDTKAIGNIVIESEIAGKVVGFENHFGTVKTSCAPLGKVLSGAGGNGDGCEGAVYKNVVATYIHGPLLPKNPSLADYIIKKAIERKDTEMSLADLDDTLENLAHDYAVGRFLK